MVKLLMRRVAKSTKLKGGRFLLSMSCRTDTFTLTTKQCARRCNSLNHIGSVGHGIVLHHQSAVACLKKKIGPNPGIVIMIGEGFKDSKDWIGLDWFVFAWMMNDE